MTTSDSRNIILFHNRIDGLDKKIISIIIRVPLSCRPLSPLRVFVNNKCGFPISIIKIIFIESYDFFMAIHVENPQSFISVKRKTLGVVFIFQISIWRDFNEKTSMLNVHDVSIGNT